MMNRNATFLCAVLSLVFAVEGQSFADILDAYENQSFRMEIGNKTSPEKYRATVRIGNIDRDRRQANCLLTISPPAPGFPKRWEFKGNFYRADRKSNDQWYLISYKWKYSNGGWEQDGKQPGPDGWQVNITIGSHFGSKMTEFSAEGVCLLFDESDPFDGGFGGSKWER